MLKSRSRFRSLRRRNADFRQPNLTPDPHISPGRVPYIRYTIALSLVIPGTISLVITIMSASEVFNETNLRKSGVSIEARITERRTDDYSGSTEFYVRYEFQPTNGSRRYTYSDSTLRSNLWAHIQELDWLNSKMSERIEVLYLPGRPRANRPVNAATDQLKDAEAGFRSFGLSTMVLATFITLILLTTRR